MNATHIIDVIGLENYFIGEDGNLHRCSFVDVKNRSHDEKMIKLQSRETKGYRLFNTYKDKVEWWSLAQLKPNLKEVKH